MFWVLMLTNGNVVSNDYRTLHAVQDLPPLGRAFRNGFNFYQGPAPDYAITWLPRFIVVCAPTELGWEQIRAWRDGDGERPSWV